METKSIRKIIFTVVAAISLFSFLRADNVITAIRENEFLKQLKVKVETLTRDYPEDRVYLHFDKPMYKPGDDIWFSAYVTEASSMNPSNMSDVLHVELLSPKGTIEQEYRLVLKNGKATGDFHLSDEMPGGIYKVKAYTRWMKNESVNQHFEKDIQIQDLVLPSLKMKLEFQRKSYAPGDEVSAKIGLNTNENMPLANHSFKYRLSIDGEKKSEQILSTGNEGSTLISFRLPEKMKSSDALLNVMIDYQGKTESISRSVPVFRNDFKVELFPEGGDLIEALPSRVAFKVTNEYGKPADISGVVMDSRGNEVTTFTSFHGGLGAFNITPAQDENYFVKITKPEGCDQTFDLPRALPMGFSMNIDNSNSKELGITIQSTETQEISLVGQLRGKVYYTNAVNVVSGTNRVVVPVNNFPAGVAQFTLFDDRGIERAERLVFVNKDKKLDITLSTNKEKYLPREKVQLTVSVRDQRGLPVPANLSLAVTNDQLLSFADDKSGNIYSEMYLTPEVKGKIDEPSFYFNPKEPKADKALDYLLMTSGWRRFSWEMITNDEVPEVTFNGEKAVLSGKVLNAYTSQPVPDAVVSLGKKKVSTDENGNFILKKADLTETANLSVHADGYNDASMHVNDYSGGLIFYLYDNRRAELERGFIEEGGLERNIDAMVPEMDDNEIAEFGMNKMMEEPRAAAIAENKVMKRKALPSPAQNIRVDAPLKEDANELRNNKQEVFDKRVLLAKNKNAEKLAAGKAMGRGNQPGKIYYRARKFPEVSYNESNQNFNREDFRTTVYWNGNLEIDKNGTKTIEFYNCDEIASFRITAEGIGKTGLIGHQEKTIYTQLPFSMNVKLPVEVVTEDQLSIPLTLVNNTSTDINGSLKVIAPSGFKASYIIPGSQLVKAGTSKTIYLDYVVMNKTGEGEFTVSFTGAGHSDSFSKKIKTISKGFPVMASFSSSELEREYEINVQNYVKGSMKGSLSAYPSVLSDLMKGVESILREPHGCFEQTSVSSYPNVMVLDYMRTTDSKDEKTIAYASNLLEKGYKRLTSFEAKDKGYEWFGASPAHEALTAYGLMQFNDMKSIYEGVDQSMIDRTAAWLMSRRDGKGGFLRNGRALDNFGAASEDITNAYIVYALAEAGYKDIRKEYEHSLGKVLDSEDPYQLALMSNASFSINENKNAMKCLEKLCKQQSEDGSFNGKSHSVTRSQGISLKVETSALSVLAMLKSNSADQNCLQKTVKFLVSSRSGHGSFGSTQGTILALKALTAYAKFSKATAEAGTIALYVNGKRVAEKTYKAGEKDEIRIEEIEKYLGEGKNKIKVRYENCSTALPYSVGITWNTSLPQSSKECALDIDLSTTAKSVKVGETLRLTAAIGNKTKEGLASPIAIIGIPAGFTFQPWQLKELSDKKLFDYYETQGNNLIIYYRQFAPEEKKTINLDLKAEIPGIYEAPASSTYLYYTNEYKNWKQYEKIQIKRG